MGTGARTRRTIITLGAVALALTSIGVPAPVAEAASRTWTGAVDGVWSTVGNWSGGAIQSGDDLVFPTGPTRTTSTNDLAPGTTIGSLTIDASGYSLFGNAVTVAGPISSTSSDGRSTSAIPTTLAGPGGPVSVASGGTLELSGAIDGTQGLTLSGGGTLELTSTGNSYTGATTIDAGVLQADGTVPTAVVLGGGTLAGSGTLAGAGISSTAPSTLDPGPLGGPGILTYTNATSPTMPTDSTFHVDLDGTTPGTGYDRLDLTNPSATFNPNGSTLAVELGYIPSVGASFQIVSQTSSSPITGRFAGLSQFGSFTVGPATFSIGYFNSGVILTVTAVNQVTATWDGGGASSTWSDAANWVGDVAPLAGSDLLFPAGAARLSNVNDLAAGFDVASIDIASAGYSLSGNAIDLIGDVAATHTTGTSTIALDVNLPSTRAFDVAAGATLVVSGSIAGATAGVSKTSPGTLQITGPGAGSYTGSTAVGAGVLDVDGSITSSSQVDVASGGTLAGSGTVPDVNVVSAGQLAPDLLSTGDLTMAAGADLLVRLDGTVAGTQYSQAAVTGTADIAGATLSISTGFTPSAGDTFTIVVNDGIDTVTGTFAGLPEGAAFSAGSLFRISYTGGTGNDVVLTAIAGTSTTVSSSALAAVAGQPVTLTATVASTDGPVTGSVEFFDGTTSLGTAVLGAGFASTAPARRRP
ncbi:MAG: autotransporter-associated beta strand repeat-containing protein [Actinobacteria bacterium]|nr:autotransporter-associated beta strand repeat-containing protein [Actinomycetota bacterium]